MKNNPAREYLWAPWRIEYILQEKPDYCVLCDTEERSDRERLIVKRGRHSYVVLNFYPYNNGHLMVCPYKHTNTLADLSHDAKAEMQQLVEGSMTAIEKVMNPDGFNIGMNLGKTAGAGIDDHLHWHVVPRWNGDTNFMPVLNHTRVQVEALEDTWQKLKLAFQEREE
ncbi:MAG: HIT family protein [Chlamydiota bacterium]